MTASASDGNGAAIDVGSLVDGRLPLTGLGADNAVEVTATMAYSRDGQGLHRSTDPADGEEIIRQRLSGLGYIS